MTYTDQDSISIVFMRRFLQIADCNWLNTGMWGLQSRDPTFLLLSVIPQFFHQGDHLSDKSRFVKKKILGGGVIIAERFSTRQSSARGQNVV